MTHNVNASNHGISYFESSFESNASKISNFSHMSKVSKVSRFQVKHYKKGKKKKKKVKKVRASDKLRDRIMKFLKTDAGEYK